jgi:Protein of unknown function (DUF3592)
MNRLLAPEMLLMYFGLAIIAACIATMWRKWEVTRILRERAADSWGTVEGLVESNDVNRGFEAGIWQADIRYSYKVEGEYFSGALVRRFTDKHYADQYAAKFPKGSNIHVRVDRADPSVSLLREKDNAQLAVLSG